MGSCNCNCNCNWGTCIAPPTRRPRAHHRVNPYLGTRRQNQTKMIAVVVNTRCEIICEWKINWCAKNEKVVNESMNSVWCVCVSTSSLWCKGFMEQPSLHIRRKNVEVTDSKKGDNDKEMACVRWDEYECEWVSDKHEAVKWLRKLILERGYCIPILENVAPSLLALRNLSTLSCSHTTPLFPHY